MLYEISNSFSNWRITALSEALPREALSEELVNLRISCGSVILQFRLSFLQAMPSQLPEHAVVSLLKQCFEIPSCQAPQLRRHVFTRSSTRAVRPSASYIQHQQKCYYTQNKATYETEASPRTNSLGISLAHRQGRSQSPVFAQQQTRGYSQGSQLPERRFAVLGGGVTGLSSAHYLAQELPNAKVVVYESGDNLGGWLKSKYVNVKNGKILFDQGPRTLRPSTPASLVTLEMVCRALGFPIGTDLS